MAHDLVIRGGTVVDGTGAPGQAADLGIDDGRIAAIGSGLAGARELDASGCVVAPGFVDIHTHYDAQVFWDPALTPSCYHGVTTVVAGNCGFSIAPTREAHRDVIARTLENVEDMNVATLEAGIPWDFETFPEYLASVERHGTVLNWAAYIGHTALRLFHMGDAAYEREATEDEIAAMAASVREAMEAGAVGLATSFAPTHLGMDGKPVPSRFAEVSEFAALGAELAKLGRGVLAATLGPGFAFNEIYGFQKEVGVPLTYTALLAMPGLWQVGKAAHEAGIADGAEVWPQVSCRKITMQMQLADPFHFNQAACFSELMSGDRTARLAAYRDEGFRARAHEELPGTPLPTRWDKITVDESAKHAALAGRSIESLATERGARPIDVVLDIALDDDLSTRFRVVQSNDDEEGIETLLQCEHMALGLSDAGAHVGMLCDAPLPTDFLGNWVRDRELMPIEQAVHRLTGEPAGIFRLEGRGTLAEGNHADVTVFDPSTVAPGPIRRVRDFPADADRLTADQPEGIRHVLVNGTPILEDGALLDEAVSAKPGRTVKQESFR